MEPHNLKDQIAKQAADRIVMEFNIGRDSARSERADIAQIISDALRPLQEENAKLQQKLDDHAEDWAFCGIPHDSQLTKLLVKSDECHKLRDALATAQEELEQAKATANHNANIGDSIARASKQVEESLQSRLATQAQELEFIRTKCKVVLWPSPTAYPVEHTLAANKDMWQEIMDAARNEPEAKS